MSELDGATHRVGMARIKNRYGKTADREQALRGARGRERAEHFANGGSPATWRGGRMWTADNKRAAASKSACRKMNRSDW